MLGAWLGKLWSLRRYQTIICSVGISPCLPFPYRMFYELSCWSTGTRGCNRRTTWWSFIQSHGLGCALLAEVVSSVAGQTSAWILGRCSHIWDGMKNSFKNHFYVFTMNKFCVFATSREDKGCCVTILLVSVAQWIWTAPKNNRFCISFVYFSAIFAISAGVSGMWLLCEYCHCGWLGIEFPSKKIQINSCFEVKITEFMLHPPLEFVTD